ncbi:response regulator PleD [Peptoclostridium acidaminophilum DSM 3953]|uniref:Response regulator PleD n=1 Tax=Peptoclostridium acidaminophilum DSM 3953 TaxID=1286171 RepID=W8U5W8_PEPAC|nr:sensor domain-containing diguanylate cyclase [Peptoclostridium acidaminophilum]AHM56321.1 response regulator PleD [Peptoclostridium acidaminophilum DSM 3953]
MDYSKLTKEELINRITELEMLNRELLREKEAETRLDFAWTGNLGHWYWNIQTNSVVFNPLKVTTLGYTKEELPQKVTYQFFTDKLHPDDYQNAMDAMLLHMKGKKSVYEVEYRIQAKDGSWKWFYDRGKITQRDGEGKPLFASGIVFDITKKKEQEISLKKKNEKLRKSAETDALTGIRNRRAIMDELESRVLEASINKSPLSIAIFDIDKFKAINDTKGHVVGDKVINEVASIIANTIRGLDSAGRYGGEEFLVILPNTDKTNAAGVAERIRKNVESHDFGEGFKVTISGGVKQFQGEEKTELIDGADKNLYEAKNGGRNKIVV